MATTPPVLSEPLTITDLLRFCLLLFVVVVSPLMVEKCYGCGCWLLPMLKVLRRLTYMAA